MTPKEQLKKLNEYYKTRRDLAIQLNCTEASINRWIAGKNISRVFKSNIDILYKKTFS